MTRPAGVRPGVLLTGRRGFIGGSLAAAGLVLLGPGAQVAAASPPAALLTEDGSHLSTEDGFVLVLEA